MRVLSIFSAFLLALPTTVVAATEWRAAEANLYWISDSEVLFVGYEPEEVKRIENGAKNQFQGSRSLIVWNSQTGAARVVAKVASSMLCYSDGSVVYEKDEGGKSVRYRGPLGREKPVTESTGIDDHVRCKWSSGGGRTIELERGTIELTRSKDDYLHWVKADGKRMELTGYRDVDLRTMFMTTGIRFYPFKGAYLLAEQGFRGKPSTVWWLYPDGRTERVKMPVGPWDKQGRINSSFAASQAGILVRLPVPMDWSLYLVQSTSIAELIKGAVIGYSVSPNGCKVAYLHRPHKPTANNRLSRVPVLRSLDVCLQTPRK